ncbi:MAG: hypothetical protein RJA20_2819 [Bacteroidota bacterium]|jgi:hypothetical protein
MNNRIYLSILILFTGLNVYAQSSRDSFTVYFFLLEECRITQAYTDRIIDIHRQYACDSTGFVALFPNPLSNDTTVALFQEKYRLPFKCTSELAAEKAEELGITVTPEVAIVNEHTREIMYRGRIDNMFERIGERRRVVTSFELEAALHAIRNSGEVPVPRTRATGCFLPERKN